MAYKFDEVSEQKKSYLRTAGLQQGANLVALNYIFNEAWEGLDIELKTADGKVFTERTFAPNKEKVFLKDVWVDGVNTGVKESLDQAVERIEGEIAQKLFNLALCYADGETIKSKLKTCTSIKDVVEKVFAVIKSNSGWQTVGLNFLTIWKNSDKNKRSNLIIAEKIKWVEPTNYTAEGHVLPAGITLTQYQKTNAMVEKYPYQGNAVPVEVGNITSDLPF